MKIERLFAGGPAVAVVAILGFGSSMSIGCAPADKGSVDINKSAPEASTAADAGTAVRTNDSKAARGGGGSR